MKSLDYASFFSLLLAYLFSYHFTVNFIALQRLYTKQ